jgi:RNA recognition motif-containing protein
MIKLFVGGFPPESEEMELAQLLSGFSQVSIIKIVRDKLSKKPKGYAFIEITEKAGTDAVIENPDAT